MVKVYILINKEKEEIILHLKDILNECNSGKIDINQVKHNVFEIAEHLEIELK